MTTHYGKKENIDGVFISVNEYKEYKKLLKAFKEFKELKKQYELFYG